MAMNFEAIAQGREPEESTPPATVPMDLETVKVGLVAAYSDELDGLVSRAAAHEVNNDADEVTAIEMAGQAKTWKKKMDEERKNIIKEPDAFVRGVNALCLTFKTQFVEIEQGLKQKVSSFGWKKELGRRKQIRAEEAERARLQKKIEAEAKKAKVDAPPPPPKVVVKKQTVVRTTSGASSHLRTEWKMTEIVDFAEVPDEYKAINAKQVTAAIRAGVRQISGLTIEEVPITILKA